MPYSVSEMNSALKHITYEPNNSYKNEFVASGIKHELGDKGFPVWVLWTKPTDMQKAKDEYQKAEPKNNAEAIIAEGKSKGVKPTQETPKETKPKRKTRRKTKSDTKKETVDKESVIEFANNPDIKMSGKGKTFFDYVAEEKKGKETQDAATKSAEVLNQQEAVAKAQKKTVAVEPKEVNLEVNTMQMESKTSEKVSLANDPEYQAQKNATIEAAVKDSDMQEQVRDGEAPDSAREQANKDFDIRTDPELNADMASMETELNRQQAREFKIPDSVSKQYLKAEDKNIFFDKQSRKVAIDASKGNIMRTHNKDTLTIHNMVALAKANNWNSIKVTGTPEFRKEAWAQASIAGLKVKGYTPTREEKQFVKAKLAQAKTAEMGNSIQKNRNIAAAFFKEKVAALTHHNVEHKKPDPMATPPKIEITKTTPSKEIER